MDAVRSISRKRKVDNDLLSDLPLSIIHCILELVPIRDAVRTSILSRQWRYKWATLPCLVFDDKCVDQNGKSRNIVRERLTNFITKTLLVHKGPIHKFGLSISFQKPFPDIDHCLLWLSRKNEIRELSLQLKVNYVNKFRVHSSIYSCQKLTHLELSRCELCPPPPLSFKGFSCLRELVLREVKVSCNSVESLVANSPLLESLTYYCSAKLAISELRISAPNLKYCEFRGCFEEISLYAPLVAEVSVSYMTKKPSQKSSVCNYTKFLGGFTSLESFKGRRYFTKYLSIGIKAYDHPLVFHHLKFIRLFSVGFHNISEALVVVCLIMGAPNLQELRLSTYSSIPKDAFEATLISLSEFRCTSNKLRVVEMSEVRCLPYELEFIKFCLRSSPVLETMTLHCSEKSLPVGIMDFMRELLSYSRASPNAKILLPLRSSSA